MKDLLKKMDTIELQEDFDLIQTRSSSQTCVDNANKEEKKITRTIDRHMMPLLCLFYFMDYLDRANIGNAT